MKAIIPVGIVIVLIIGGFILKATNDGVIYAEKPVATTTATSTEPDVPVEWATEAQEAFDAVIRRKTLEADLNAVEAEIGALEARKVELEKELGHY